MATFAVIYRYSTDSAALDEHRPAHRDYLESLYDAGVIVRSGPLSGQGQPSALLVLDCADEEQVLARLDPDPFHQEGLIVEREIRPWSVVFGADR
jgi:uncharacterized protein YciI